MQLSKNAETQRTRILLANQVHLVLFLVIDFHNHSLLNRGGFDELPRFDFLGVRKELFLKIVIDVLLDQDVVTIFLRWGSVLQDDTELEANLLSHMTTAADRHRAFLGADTSCVL